MRIPDRAGDYDQRIIIQKLKDEPTQDAFGQVDNSDDDNWETYTTRWAAIEPITSREQIRGGQVEPIGQYRVRMRSDSTTRAITTAMRISWNGRTLNIDNTLDKHAQKREVELTAKESQ